jgi:galactitol-specific phosphotransferase system IIB component
MGLQVSRLRKAAIIACGTVVAAGMIVAGAVARAAREWNSDPDGDLE